MCGRKKEMEVAKKCCFYSFPSLVILNFIFCCGSRRSDYYVCVCVLCLHMSVPVYRRERGVQHNKITSKKKKNFEMKEVSAKPTKYLLNSFCFYMHTRFKMRMPCKKVYFRIRNSITVLFFFLLLSCNVFFLLLSFIMMHSNFLPSTKCIHNK